MDWETPDADTTETIEPVDFDDDVNLSHVFFDKLFPNVKGHAKLIDKYFQDPRSSMHATVKNDKIVFHDPEADDPDWRVKMCYSLMIAGVTELENGVENLWK